MSMKKSTKRRLKIFLCIAVIIIASFAFGSLAMAWVYNEPYKTLELDDYLKDGKFKGVDVYQYECGDKELEEAGIAKNFSCRVSGFYSCKDDRLFINSDKISSDRVILITLFHEYGHYIWYQVLNQSERDAYESIYRSSDSFVSNYAFEGGAFEDWAETYAAYMTGFEEVPKNRMAFIKDARQKYAEI